MSSKTTSQEDRAMETQTGSLPGAVPGGKACQGQCEGCALKAGAAANGEPTNYLKAVLCVLTPLPFWCHRGIDWAAKDVEEKRARSAELVKSGEQVICQGWRAEVARLGATGYYGVHSEVTRLVGQMAVVELDNVGDHINHPSALENVKYLFEMLIRKAAEFGYQMPKTTIVEDKR